MLSKDSEPRVELELTPRPMWLWFLLVVHAAAGAAAFLTAFDLLLKALLAAAIACSLARQLAIHWKQTAPRAIRAVVWHGDGRWQIADGRGTLAAELTGYYLGSHLVILNFRHHPAVLIWSGNTVAQAPRRLRMRLRHGRALAGQSEQGRLLVRSR
ncbi:MAG TPA: hypothetical protein VFH85_00405 [Gammaproteobacteria bacterium]|nr:hypothetical protein [Gammaproteobacteria bacterium]